MFKRHVSAVLTAYELNNKESQQSSVADMTDKDKIIDKLLAGQIPSAEELDALHGSFGVKLDIKRRRLLQDKYGFLKATPIKNGLMAFGFDCKDGWMAILEQLFEDVADVAKRDSLSGFRVVQVREKFGMLMVYYENGNRDIDSLVKKAMERSKSVCEKCGESGSLRDIDGWYATLCDRCFKHRRKKPGLGGLSI